jgi:subfamily B ATP-binding cassette protein MsbA
MVLYGAVWVLSTAVAICSGSLLAYLSERVSMGLRRRLLAHSAALSLFFSQAHSGRTMSLFTSDVPATTSLVGQTLTQALGSVVTLVVAAALMFALSPQLAVAGALAPPLVAVAAAVFVTRPLRPAARRLQDKLAELTEGVHENLAGTREVVAFGRERTQETQFSTTLRELLRLRMRLTLLEGGVRAGQSMFSLAITVVILGYGGYLVIHGDTTLGTVIAMRSLFGLVVGPAGRLFGLVSEAQRAVAAADRIYEFLDEVPRVQQTPAARPPANVRGQVAFRGVSFAYRPGHPVLQNLSFTVSPGERIALVGPSGAGKSTLASLVARFYDPTDGQILLDGVDLRDLTLPGLRGTIGIVFQNTFLFASTVRENIAFGRDGASSDEVIAAARAANAWEFIADLPEGLDTEVGERGVLLSEGQRQRIAIARALLRDPRILILDEPTSALDARSEHLVRSALTNLVRDRTTFVIAHRLGTVIGADRILVLDGGRIVQQGVHNELVRQEGMYRDLFRLQFPEGGVRTGSEGLPAASPVA